MKMQLLFMLFPFLELYTLIAFGAAYGALTAIVWVILSIMLGMSMIRRQGLSMIRKLQEDAERGLITSRLLGDDLAVVTSGLLLIVPGLVTDVMAALVLIGPLRRRLLSGLTVRQTASSGGSHTGPGQRTDRESFRDGAQRRPEEPSNVTLEGDYTRLDDD